MSRQDSGSDGKGNSSRKISKTSEVDSEEEEGELGRIIAVEKNRIDQAYRIGMKNLSSVNLIVVV